MDFFYFIIALVVFATLFFGVSAILDKSGVSPEKSADEEAGSKRELIIIIIVLYWIW